METANRILELCRSLRCQTAMEKPLQDALEAMLRENFTGVEREARLSSRDVVDFLVDGVAVEVKVEGAVMAVTRQLQRYAKHENVTSLVLVTTRAKHRTTPTTLLGKPVQVAWINPF